MVVDAPTELFLGGKWVPASSGGRFDVLDPATGDVVASVADGTVEDAIAAVDAADAAAAGWAATAPRQRAEILRRAFELMTERADELARLISLENGKALGDAARRGGLRGRVLPLVRRGGRARGGLDDRPRRRGRTGSSWCSSRSASPCS